MKLLVVCLVTVLKPVLLHTASWFLLKFSFDHDVNCLYKFIPFYGWNYFLLLCCSSTFLWLSTGMDDIGPFINLYWKRVMVGRGCGGSMHWNLYWQMFIGNCRRLHGPTLGDECKFFIFVYTGIWLLHALAIFGYTRCWLFQTNMLTG